MPRDFHVGDWLVQPELGRMTREGRTVLVRAKVMDVLEFLARRPGEVVSKDALLDGVWHAEAVSESALTRTVTELRQLFNDDADRPTVVETISKRGYRLIAPVRHLPLPDLLAGAVPTATTPPRNRTPRLRRLGIVLGGAGLLLLEVVAVYWGVMRPGQSIPATVTRFTVDTSHAPWPRTGRPLLALSPDGQTLAYETTGGLALRKLDAWSETVLPGTQGGTGPFFSPDGTWLGFFLDNKLTKIPLAGGSPMTICPAPNARGASWGDDDGIVVALGADGLMRVAASGGRAEQILAAETGEYMFWPFVLPGAKAVLFTSSRGPGLQAGRIMAVPLDSRKPTVVVEPGADAEYADGTIVFGRGRSAWAAAFDVERLTMAGIPSSVLNDVARYEGNGGTQLTLARTGTLAYVTPPVTSPSRLAIITPDGREELLPVAAAPYTAVRLSPDATTLAVATVGRPLATLDLRRHVLQTIGETAASSDLPAWRPDSTSIVYRSETGGVPAAWEIGRSGGPPHEVIASTRWTYPHDVTADGAVIYSEQQPKTGWDLFIKPAAGPARVLVQTDRDELGARVSPDQRTIAFQSNTSGRYEVYVTPISGDRPRMQISDNGGREPVWSRNGRALYYREGPYMMRVRIGGTPELTASRPERLFEAGLSENYGAGYDVLPDGRFVVVRMFDVAPEHSGIRVVLNWLRDVRTRAHR